MECFESLLEAERVYVERYVKVRIYSRTDADDLLQDIYLTAYQNFSQLKNHSAFKAWILSIARNKCNDYFRKRAAQFEISIDELPESELSDGRLGITEVTTVRETLELMSDKDKQILFLFFWKDMPQSDIAKLLGIPIGTVKSRLYTAKHNFRSIYPYHTDDMKGTSIMKKLPQYLPEYKIEISNEQPFSVEWEELMGWFLIPKIGEKLSWAMYDIPSRKRSHVYHMKVTGKARVHGIEGIEFTARETAYSDKAEVIERTFVAQLTDSHCRYLAALRNDGGVRNYITFLDGDEFMNNWGYGNDNCGNEIDLYPKNIIQRTDNIVTSPDQDYLLDIVGRYTITIGEKTYDTVCVMDIEAYNCGVVSEQYLDRSGRTILWRRFNRNNWAIDYYKKLWSEQLPDNEHLTINGITYVHWYDCITDYIL